ncbi:Histidine-specific methyltransferase EgtD [Planctomycetes bacterium Poly30]|uniref:Histidine-specific methyltransferase EgtD n=1 Tax=Saltatorellus ferox TaxID=2528018 RepID=A0A518EPU7_9BACT|nr:Histidine-specific methyltransferase EgtD [Planctomycetes bacterium Poly30]
MIHKTEAATAAPESSPLHAILDGLRANPRTLPAALFYDDRGSKLFDAITRLPEYYQTRTERAILEDVAPRLLEDLGDSLELVEFGAGSAEKTETLLRELDVQTYLPIDVSEYYLETSAERLRGRFPDLQVRPILADYTRPVKLGPMGAKTRVGFFPGGTIGNYHPEGAAAFLRRASAMLGPGGAFILGADLLKDPARLHAAYNDAAGVTAEFNLNILRHLNESHGADFHLDRWYHHALFDPKNARIEMHLVSDREQVVEVGGERFEFDAFESIWTESSYKYSESKLRRLARAGDFECEEFWTDPDRLFSVSLLRVPDKR